MFEALGIEHLGLFMLAGWLLNLTPGPDVLCIVSNALRSGMRAGVAAALGVTTGCFIHIFAAAVGVSALLAASAAAFTVLKWLGAAYLLYAGVRLFISAGSDVLGTLSAAATDAASAVLHQTPRSFKEIFYQGFLTNALNPKVALFFLAFVPQFIAPGAPNHALVFLLLGCIFNINAIPVNIGFAAIAALAARRLDAVQRSLQRLDRIAGVMFIAFGLKLALTDRPSP
jgi:threonine/homoserine/homoserine lactone efflux protein